MPIEQLPSPERGMPIVPLGPNGLKTAQLVDQAHGHVLPRPDGRRAPCAGPAGCWTCHLESLVYESKLNLFVDQGLNIKPNDKILLIAPAAMDPERVREHVDMLKRRFPDTEFTIVAGYTGVQIASTNG
jgi:hypothetical protein